MNERPTEFSSGLVCPRCGRTLTPVPTGSDVTFHCKSGHEFPLTALLAAQSSSLRCGLEALLEEWSRQHQALLGTSEDARARGYVDIAEIFARHARSLKSRIDLLRAGFAMSDSARLLAVPSRVRMN